MQAKVSSRIIPDDVLTKYRKKVETMKREGGGASLGSKNTGEISIIFEDLSRNSVFFSNRS